MNKISFKEVPESYTLCVQSACPMAEHCLRQMAMHVLTPKHKIIQIVNPLHTQPNDKCEFYRSDAPQIFARGFTNMQDEMLPRQYKVFMKLLQTKFGRTGYFERRRGERLCSPNDIKIIEEVLQEIGMQHLGFDAYEELYNWID